LVVIRSCKARPPAPGKGLGDDAVRERHRIRQHRGMRGEIGKAHFRAHRQWMIGRDHHMQRVVPEWRGTQRWLRWAERGQGEFGAALQDPRIRLFGIHETQVQRYPRVQRAETAQQVRKPMQADVVAGGEAEALLYIDRHLVHEVTSPQAFEGLQLAGRKPWRSLRLHRRHGRPQHYHRPPLAHGGLAASKIRSRAMQVETLDANIARLRRAAYFPFMDDRARASCTWSAPEQGATLPGMTVVCGDSHTSTHGAFGCAGARHRHLRGRACAGHAVPAAEG
jgi:hypothetical protein